MQADYAPYSPSPDPLPIVGAMAISEDHIPLSLGMVGNIMHRDNLTPAVLKMLIRGLLATINKQQDDHNTMMGILADMPVSSKNASPSKTPVTPHWTALKKIMAMS
jgi:hypothetical protein